MKKNNLCWDRDKCDKLSASITWPRLPGYVMATEDAHVEVSRMFTCACVKFHVNAPLSPWHTELSVPVQATLLHQRGHTMGLCPNPHPELFLPFYLCSTEVLVPKLHNTGFLENGQNSGSKPRSPELLSCMLRSLEESWCISSLVKAWA